MAWTPERIQTTAIGAFTTVVGAGLLARPDAAGDWLGARDDTGLRMVGVVDLVVAMGLLFGRPRSAWVYARAAANLPTAAYLLTLDRRSKSKVPKALAGALLAVTASDLKLARDVAASERAREDSNPSRTTE